MDSNASPVEIGLYVVAAIGLGYAFIKGFIIGFYPDEQALLFGAGIVGALAAAGASRLTTRRKAAETEARDRAKGVH